MKVDKQEATLRTMLRGPRYGVAAKVRGVALLVAGEELKQGMIGLCAERFRAVAVVAQAVDGKDAHIFSALRMFHLSQAIFRFKFVESEESDAKPAVEVAEDIKDLRFELVTAMARALRFSASGTRVLRMLGLRLRHRIGAYSCYEQPLFACLRAGELRSGRVRC